jgi:hypothetical protein
MIAQRDIRLFLADVLVGAARFELATPSPPDWCANQAAPRSDQSESAI